VSGALPQQPAMKKKPFALTIIFIVVVSGLALALSAPYAKRQAASMTCGNYMASIGCGARTWALDNGGHLAPDFRSMSNELAITRILVCPSDHQRIPAKDWASLGPTNCSYEIVAPGMSADDTTNVYFRCRLHGHLGYADGTVFDGKRRRTKVPW
jgi:hypothetical protein